MTDRTKRLLSLLLSLALGAGLLWLALRNADLGAVAEAFAAGEWLWMIPFVGLGLVSVALRAWRWGLLLDALPGRTHPVPLTLTSASVAIGYLVNYAAPRLGEVARSANVSRRADVPFSGVLGTVVAERILDVLMLGLALLSVVALYGDRVGAILGQAWATVSAWLALPAWVWVTVGVVTLGGIVGVVAVLQRGRGRLAGLLAQFQDGLTSVVRTGRPGAIVVSTVALWVCYGLMSDVPFRLLGMDEAYGLGPVDAWAVMAVGGIGMALPSPGGTGSFHYATVLALTLLFAVGDTPAATYALLVHAAGVVFYCVLGVVALAAQGTTVGSIVASPPKA